jgi:16S rRNA (guanine(527)-N(7))-methyltransferase RsmG
LPDFLTHLEREFHRLRLKVSSDVQGRLAQYAAELERWNGKLNLTSLRGHELVRRLIAEPVWIAQELQMSGILADIGSGNGSPGVPLAIACNLNKIHLVEARTRRAAFLRHVSNVLGLAAVVHKIRVEEMSEPLGDVDWISVQAVLPTPELSRDMQKVFPPTTRVVWISSENSTAVVGALRVSVPGSTTVASVFQLDQF